MEGKCLKTNRDECRLRLGRLTRERTRKRGIENKTPAAKGELCANWGEMRVGSNECKGWCKLVRVKRNCAVMHLGGMESNGLAYQRISCTKISLEKAPTELNGPGIKIGPPVKERVSNMSTRLIL